MLLPPPQRPAARGRRGEHHRFSDLLLAVRDGRIGAEWMRSAGIGVRQSASACVNTLVQTVPERMRAVEATAGGASEVNEFVADLRRASRSPEAEPAREVLSGFYCEANDLLAVNSVHNISQTDRGKF